MAIGALTAIPPTPAPATQRPAEPLSTQAALRELTSKIQAPVPASKDAPAGPKRFDVSIAIDEASKHVVVTITDPETGEVVGELPPEQIRRIAASIREMLAPMVDEIV